MAMRRVSHWNQLRLWILELRYISLLFMGNTCPDNSYGKVRYLWLATNWNRILSLSNFWRSFRIIQRGATSGWSENWFVDHDRRVWHTPEWFKEKRSGMKANVAQEMLSNTSIGKQKNGRKLNYENKRRSRRKAERLHSMVELIKHMKESATAPASCRSKSVVSNINMLKRNYVFESELCIFMVIMNFIVNRTYQLKCDGKLRIIFMKPRRAIP